MRGLKIYACSGFAGVGARDEGFTYWRDNTVTVNNTRAVNGLLADINMLFSNLQYRALTDKEILESLNAIDLYAVTLQGVKRYTGMPDMLERWGGVICSMADEGLFANSSMDNNDRDIYLDRLIEDAFLRMGSNEGYTLRGSLSNWYRTEILDEDWNGIQSGGIDAFRGLTGVGGDKDAGDVLNDSGYYFFGTYLTEKQIDRGGVAIRTKVKYERSLYQRAQDTYASLYAPEKFAEVVYCGCQSTLRQKPELFANEVFGKTSGIGVAIEAILSLIAAVVPSVISATQWLIERIFIYFENKDRLTLKPDELEDNMIDPQALRDAYNNAHNGTTKAGISGFLMWGLVLGAIYKLIIKRN